MHEGFGQATTPVGSLRSILGRYPFSIGLLREILQNSDDAGASKQVLLLNRRKHTTASLFHQNLATTQGPALLAYNDAKFDDGDWYALQYAYESSKADDSSKIGKYGVGFRSVFHVTDCPQIISGNTFAMFDPLCDFIGSIGVRKDLSFISSQYPGQLAPFQYFAERISPEGFEGTVIRCPLRAKPSRIAPKVVQADDISNLFRKFVDEELDISLLFLQNIQHLEIHEIDEDGVSTCLATLSVSRSPIISTGLDTETHTMTTTTTTFANSIPRSKKNLWRILHCPFSKDEAIKLISEGFPGDATSILKQHKLLPNVGIAFPLDPKPSNRTPGRLFTFLPLPVFTGFPVHVHALFAITESRQNLRNPQEIGIVEGSDDQMLIGWNRLLFDHYIPQAWKLFLELLVQSDNTIDVLAAWPPKQGSPTSGEAVYWQSLPSNLLKTITSSTSSVWPVYTNWKSTSTIEYRPLHLLITAEPSTSLSILDALTSMGLHLMRPPAYIYDLIKDANGFSLLTPEVAHSALLAQLDTLQLASKEDRSIVLEYLLSITRDVRNIIDLPLISISNGQIIALSTKSAGSSSKPHSLLNKIEYEIFGACDDDAIPLQNLPLKVADILQTQGSKLLNVETLDVHHIVNYLTMYPNRMGLDLSLVRVDQRVIKWFSAFWVWMGTYEKKEDLFTKIRHLYLLPSKQGLRKADKPLFRALKEHPNFVQHFTSLGISFLDTDVHESAHNVIESFHLLKRITDIHALLDSLPELLPSGAEFLPQNACTAILRHLGTHAPGSCFPNSPFTEKQIKRLKTLPIFPMTTFPPSNTGIVVERSRIPNGVSLRSIESPLFLPSLPGIGFIQLDNPTLAILDYLDSTAKRFSVMDILSLTVDNFISQEDYVQAAALNFLCLNRDTVPPIIIETLRNLPFVSVKDNSRRKPIEVVDPSSKLVALYEETPARLVRVVTVAEKKIARSLQDLNLMQRVLTLALAQERIDFISGSSSPNAIKISRSLISLIISSRLDCSGLKVTPEKRWLPTNQGLRGSLECRDAALVPSYLFDHVLATFELFTIPSSLKHVLGWDQPLPKEVLIKQLDHVLQTVTDDRIFSKVFDIIKELSLRSCNSSDFNKLKMATSGRKWVPTTDNQLMETQNSVFLTPILESGFHQVLFLDAKMREFLARMGCTDRPTAEAIIANLKILQNQPISLNQVNTSLNMLKSLPEELDETERSQLLVPDTTGCLRPFEDVYFNDIGNHASLVSSDAFIVHHLLEESLARRLRLGRLGLKYDEFTVPYIDMGEDLITTICNNLKHYTEQQFATEFLANAIDANANEFSLLVNKFHPPDDENIRALSKNMRSFCTSPSLVVHNNSTFTDKDFIGIRRTGVGGKDGERDTIGQFGLGVLTMFHFAELAILVSNDHVLFLDPSKEHLPIPDVASLMLPLDRVRKYYSSHLASIDGLFGFDISSDEPYNGTIFILPLRETKHFENSSNAISRQIYTADIVEREVLEKFRERATNCLLFTEITKIDGLTRETSGKQNILWSFGVHRTPEEYETDDGYLATEVQITNMEDALDSRWRIVTASVAEDAIPREILLPLSNHRLRIPAVAGLAILLEDESTFHESRPYRFFSTLPLGIKTSLPCHIMASFLLSSDRRSIRLDEHGIESKFNIWLLSNVLPRLYMFLLQISLEHGDNKQWWPGQHRSKEDAHSRIFIDAFYSEHLKASSRPVFYNVYNHEITLSAQQVVLSGEEPPNIERLLSILRSDTIAQPSKGVYQLMTKKSDLPTVNPTFVKSAIIQASPSIFSQFSFKVIEDCITYLLEKEEDSMILHGLPIIPLENGAFGTFQTRSTADTESYHIWMPHKSTKQHNFPTRHFVHSSLKTKIRETLLKMDLNVVLLDTAIMRKFIARNFPSTAPYRYEAPSRLSNWIYDFWESWDEYARLGLSYDDVSDFPLVPTIRPSSYVTLASCKNASSLLVGGNSEEFENIRSVLDSLDVNVIRLSDDGEIPVALHRMLTKDHDYPTFNLENVLKVLGQRNNNISETIREFDRELQTIFADWARSNANQPIPPPLQSVAQQLPVWLSGRNGLTDPELRPASDVFMLPEGLGFDITARFMSVYVAEYGSLRFFNGPKLTHTQLQERLELRGDLPIADLIPYRQLLEIWLPRLPAAYTEPIPIPDCDRIIQPSNALYAREALFEAAFGTTSPVFIHPEFQQLEGLLYKHGLKTESQLDINMFTDCANALEASQIDVDATDDQVARARVLFEAYGFSLPMCIAAGEEDQWHDLDDFCFIPRNMARRRLLETQEPSLLGLEIPTNVSALPRIVSPGDLVREEFEPVAWTQRGSFAHQPNQRVLLAYPDLGRPSVSEVVAHIRVLSSLTDLSHSQREVVIHDLERSYEFLDDNSISGESSISWIGNENLFLNVNDPNIDDWKWDKAEELVFEKYDVDQNIRHVRNFLLPFGKLLRAAGALQIYYPEYQSNQTLDTSDSKLRSIRSGFQRLREKNVLTDVVFIANDEGVSSEPLMAHRSFLAVSSEYFSDLFAGGFEEARAASTEDRVECSVLDYSTECVRLVLDYIYKEEHPSVDMFTLTSVLDILNLSSYWSIVDLFEHMQREIALKLLKPRSINQIRTSAEAAGADNLVQACNAYEENNQTLMMKVR